GSTDDEIDPPCVPRHRVGQLMTLGTASIVLLLLAGSQLSDTMSRDARGIDLVVGAPGSPVQLVLATVYHADIPPGNIDLGSAEKWADDPRVESAVPVSIGDSFRGYRIVGTRPAFADIYDAEIATGRFWDRSLEAVLGATAAAKTGLTSGATFSGAHGLGEGGSGHEEHPYEVVGILQPTGTVLDRLILTSLESVWDLHAPARPHDDEHADSHADEHSVEDAHHDAAEHKDEQPGDHSHDGHGERSANDADREVTAMLIRYATPMAAITLPREINAADGLQAAAPAVEVARLLQLVGLGLEGLSAVAWMLILTAALSVFAALYGSLRARRSDLAILRCLGATRWELLVALLLEGLVLTIIGVLLGLIVAHGAMELLGGWLESSRGVALTGWTWIAAETWLLLSLVGVGVVAAAIPAVQAYRTDVARVLAEI
ncbi:MAG: ABC transporter permease, partial [Pseudomonadota bacterium]